MDFISYRQSPSTTERLLVDSGNYVFGDGVEDVFFKAKAEPPDRIFYVVRVGRRAVSRVSWV